MAWMEESWTEFLTEGIKSTQDDQLRSVSIECPQRL